MIDSGGNNTQPNALAIDHLLRVLEDRANVGDICPVQIGVAAASVAHRAGRLACAFEGCQHGEDLIRAAFEGGVAE